MLSTDGWRLAWHPSGLLGEGVQVVPHRRLIRVLLSAPSELGVSCRVKVPFDRLTATSTRGGRTGLGDPGGFLDDGSERGVYARETDGVPQTGNP